MLCKDEKTENKSYIIPNYIRIRLITGPESSRQQTQSLFTNSNQCLSWRISTLFGKLSSLHFLIHF